MEERLARLADGLRRAAEARARLVPAWRLRERLAHVRPAGRLERPLRRDPGGPLRLACAVGAPGSAGRAAACAGAGAAALSAPLAALEEVRAASGLPLLLEEPVVDEYQLLEAAAHGADGVTLVAALSGDVELQVRVSAARMLGLDPLVRVADAAELRTALRAGATLLALAGRALPGEERGLAAALDLATRVPPLVTAVAPAAALEPEDVRRLAGTRCDALWIGPGADPGATAAAIS